MLLVLPILVGAICTFLAIKAGGIAWQEASQDTDVALVFGVIFVGMVLAASGAWAVFAIFLWWPS